MSKPTSGEASVPSPTQSFSEYLPFLTAALDRLTTNAASLPDKTDLNFHRSLDRRFNKDVEKTSERLLGMTERILDLIERSQKEARQGRDKGKTAKVIIRRRKLEDQDDIIDGYRGAIQGVIDGLLEDAVRRSLSPSPCCSNVSKDINLDELRGGKGKTAITIKPALAAQAGKKVSEIALCPYLLCSPYSTDPRPVHGASASKHYSCVWSHQTSASFSWRSWQCSDIWLLEAISND